MGRRYHPDSELLKHLSPSSLKRVKPGIALPALRTAALLPLSAFAEPGCPLSGLYFEQEPSFPGENGGRAI
ncbi:hypothetical protein HMPREF1986_02566 [Oribacterium sp. oral taxon 078 str. F0263]|nr:hypothetical protein HMPREF1986_02566 [Oribacterium sp. oral taxon 078 str. F0263]